MGRKTSNRALRDRRVAVVGSLYASFLRGDFDDPPALDEEDREALRVAVRVATECDQAFRKILRSGRPIGRTDDVDRLCDTIRAALDSFAVVKQTASILRGSHETNWTPGNMRALLVRHGTLFSHVRRDGLDLVARLSLLLALIRIELLFFAHFW